MENKTPSMDDKDTPSPPQNTSEQWEALKAQGTNSLPHWKVPVEIEKEVLKGNSLEEDIKNEVPGTSIREIMATAMDTKIAHYKAIWETEKLRLEGMIHEAVRDKSHLPDNYWIEEHRAHALYKAALELKELLSC